VLESLCSLVFVIEFERKEDRLRMSEAVEQEMEVTSALVYRESVSRWRGVFAG
jgi:hypothetical protein